MIEEQRYKHANGTMWISHREKLISGNVAKIKSLNKPQIKTI